MNTLIFNKRMGNILNTDKLKKYIDNLPENIIELNLGCQDLKELPDLSRLKNLKELYCYNNQLSTIPNTVTNNLILLCCSNNKLTNIPVLNNLEMLGCNNNRLTNIPVLNKLKKLYCKTNNITTLPVLNNLKQLYCYNTPLYNIIEENIEKLKILQRFIELFYLIKFKKKLRDFLWEKIRLQKIKAKYHPDNLIKLIEGKDEEDIETILEKW
jgi:Leucine-rich repeat (LRR) protein